MKIRGKITGKFNKILFGFGEKQRFKLTDIEGKDIYLTVFGVDKVKMLDNFNVNDEVEILYNTKENTKDGIKYTNHYCNEIHIPGKKEVKINSSLTSEVEQEKFKKYFFSLDKTIQDSLREMFWQINFYHQNKGLNLYEFSHMVNLYIQNNPVEDLMNNYNELLNLSKESKQSFLITNSTISEFLFKNKSEHFV